MQPSVSVEARVDDGVRVYAIKIGTPSFEVNVDVPHGDAPRLKKVSNSPWLSGALRIGTSAGAPAWWCVAGQDEEIKGLSILVGHDDQTWDIALQLPLETIDAVVHEVDVCARQQGDA